MPAEVALGATEVVATGATSERTASAALEVLDSPVVIAPVIELDRTEAEVGDVVTVTLSAFTPSGDVALVLGDGIQLGTIAVDADGRGSFEFTVPTTVQIGALEIVATDAATGQSASAALEIVGQSTEEPGDDQPGTEEPGDDQPGTDEPGDDRPGAQDPGTQPGAGDPKTDAKDGGLAATGAGDFTAVAALAGLLVLAGAGTLMARRKR